MTAKGGPDGLALAVDGARAGDFDIVAVVGGKQSLRFAGANGEIRGFVAEEKRGILLLTLRFSLLVRVNGPVKEFAGGDDDFAAAGGFGGMSIAF